MPFNLIFTTVDFWSLVILQLRSKKTTGDLISQFLSDGCKCTEPKNLSVEGKIWLKRSGVQYVTVFSDAMLLDAEEAIVRKPFHCSTNYMWVSLFPNLLT